MWPWLFRTLFSALLIGFVVDFENKVTSMKNKVYGDHFDWVIKKATSSEGDPPNDVTSGMGHYLLLKTYGKRTGQKASYVSNGISRSDNGACLSFYYFINGKRGGKLTVSILSKSGWVSTAKVLWSNTGNQSGNWKFAKVSLPKTLTSQSYDIMFTGTVGTDHSGSLAIDDITLKNTGVCWSYRELFFLYQRKLQDALKHCFCFHLDTMVYFIM